MNRIERLLEFTVSGLHCALAISEIERVLHAVQINPVPRAPEIVLGLINVQGQIIPVLNIRRLFRLDEVEMSLNARIIVAKAAGLSVAIVVDTVVGVCDYNELEITIADRLYPDIEFLQGIAKLKDGVVYIYSLDTFLSSDIVAEIMPLLKVDTPICGELTV